MLFLLVEVVSYTQEASALIDILVHTCMSELVHLSDRDLDVIAINSRMRLPDHVMSFHPIVKIK